MKMCMEAFADMSWMNGHRRLNWSKAHIACPKLIYSLKDPLPHVVSITTIKPTSLGDEKTASLYPSTQQATGQKTRQNHWKHYMVLQRWVRGGQTLPAGSGLDMVMRAWGQDKVADWGEEQHWSWQSFHATVQLIPSHSVPQSHRLLPPRQISNVSFLVCFPALLFLFISICALLKLLLERAGVFRSVMETAENAILPPLLAGHVVDDNLGGAGGWCGNEGSRKRVLIEN